MWFVFALVTTLAWGAADLFYKKGNNESETNSHLKTVVTVGIVMGLTGIGTLIFGSEGVTLHEIIMYLPVSLLYIISMAIGYFGLRYLYLSISSPIQNSSGAMVALLYLCFGEALGWMDITATVLIGIGIIALALFERAQVPMPGEKKAKYGALAIIFPLLYCVLDAAGTYIDGLYLDTYELIGEEAAQIAYYLTFAAAGAICYVYIAIREKKAFNPFANGNRIAASVFETAGQFTYVYAMAGNASVAAPMVASYCAVAVLLSRITLREKLRPMQYAAIAVIFAGIVLFGISEGLAG